MEYRRVPINGQALVVTFDMCSSSTVIEELTKACDVQRLSAFITELKRHLAELQRVTPFDPYKFTGDGWILLFPAETPGPGLLAVLEGVCTFFADRFPRSVLSYLPHRPKSIGLTFGIDKGELIAMKMFKQPEYVGRAINIACRLQSAVGAKGRPPAYNALVTNRVFNEYFADLKLVRVDRVKRILRNINNGSTFRCRRISLMRSGSRNVR